MKKKALIISIAVLIVIGIFSFVNIFKVGQSFVKHTRFAEGVGDITDATHGIGRKKISYDVLRKGW